MSSQQELPRLVMPLLSLPFQPAARSCVKVQVTPHLSLLQVLLAFGPACSELLTHHLTNAPRSPASEGQTGLSLCPSPCSVLERAASPVLRRVPATRQNSVPFDIKPFHTHRTARPQQIVCPGQLKKESSSLIFHRQDVEALSKA